MKTLITGGTGLVGRSLVQRLQGRFPLRITARSQDKARFAKIAGVEVFLGDLQDKDFVCEAMRGTDCVVHLAATFDATDALKANTIFMKNIIASCRNNGIDKVIFMSSINSKFKKQGPYSLAKKICEEELSKSGLDFCILRPTLIYDDCGGVFLSQLVKFIKKFHVAPIMGTGEYLMQPIHLDDVVAVTGMVLTGHKLKEYDLVGPDIVTNNSLAEMICDRLGIKRRIKINLPLSFLKLVGPMVGIGRDKILEIDENRTGNPDILKEEFGISLVSIKDRLASIVNNLS